MKKLKLFSYMIIVLTLCMSCDDILEEDISNDTVQIIAPSSGAVIEGNNVQFTWNGINGADEYRIQVFNNQQINVLDSLVTTTIFNYVVSSGNYQWRIRGENFAYVTEYSFPQSFSVETSDDLSTQVVVLETPSPNFYTKDPNILFTWAEVESAVSYSLELIKNLNGMQTVLQEDGINTNSFNVMASVLNEDAEYIWKVKAVNDSSQTPFATRTFFLDRIPPNQPSLVSPTNTATTTTIVDFNWTNGSDTGNTQSEITNTIEIANDIDFNSIVISDTTVNNSYQFSFNDIGTYYWRVKARDAAGNESDNSIVRSFTVQ